MSGWLHSTSFYIPFKSSECTIKLNGINIIEQEESYTSKVSFIDNDYIPTYNKDDDKLNVLGKRIKRGLDQTKNSHYINADINGGFNIM